MHKHRSAPSIQKLLVSSSVFGLTAGWALGTAAAPAPSDGTEVVDDTVESVQIGALESTDYILIGNSLVEGQVSNAGNVGAGSNATPNVTGVLITESNVEGGVLNTGNIAATEHGISVEGSQIGDGVTNEGNIVVDNGVIYTTVGAFLADDAAGIRVVDNDGANIATNIDNSGLIDVEAASVGFETLSAFGIRVGSSGNVDAQIGNSGDIEVDAMGGEGTVSAAGISVTNNPGELVAPKVLAEPSEATPREMQSEIVNSSLSSIDVFASGSGTVGATGIEQAAVGVTDASLAVENSGAITAEAVSGNSDFSVALAQGIEQEAIGATPSSDAELSANNSGEIVAHASVAQSSEQNIANAAGISQLAGELGAADIEARNSGNITVRAEAAQQGQSAGATATAAGIRQDAFFVDEVDGYVENTSSSSIDVVASASATEATGGTVDAEALGILQSTLAGNVAQNQIENSGAIRVGAAAEQSTTASAGGAESRAIGIGQFTDAFGGEAGTGDVSSYIGNEAGGLILSESVALAQGVEPEASANAGGIFQRGIGTGDVEGDIDQDGSIDVQSLAIADSTTEGGGGPADARAVGFGVLQELTSEGGMVTADLRNTSDSSIEVVSVGNAAAGTAPASAAAVAAGAVQFAETGGSGEIELDNSGTIDVLATTTASGGTVGSSASALGVSQSGFAQSETTVDGDNSGSIVARADSEAEGNILANIARSVGWQQGGGSLSGSANVTLTNSGEISSVANAAGFVEGGGGLFPDAVALANGVRQFARSEAGTANAEFENSGSLLAFAQSEVSLAEEAPFEADLFSGAEAVALSQQARAGGNASVSAINTSGSSIDAIALSDASAPAASSETYEVMAGAEAAGILQNVLAEPGNAQATIENSGAITVLAESDASGAGEVDAYAFGVGVSQESLAAEGDAGVALDNSGSIDVVATGNAALTSTVAASPAANVDANAVGVRQLAAAAGGNASASLVNSSQESIAVTAQANADGGAEGNANADAAASGIVQEAEGRFEADGAEGSIENSGSITASAFAVATSEGDLLSANADADADGIGQGVAGETGATGLVTNTSSESIDVSASAVADALGNAAGEADAAASGIEQYVDADNGNATGNIQNSGAINVTATGNAQSESGSAEAYADVWGITQEVGADGQQATGIVANNGSLDTGAIAVATSEENTASAAADGTGISQNVYEGNADTVVDGTVTNSSDSSLDVTLVASATGREADADVFGTGIDQNVYSENGAATAEIDNSGTLSVVGRADALVDGDGVASANSYSTGVSQYVDANYGNATGTVDNAGTLNVTAVADATKTQSVSGATTGSAEAAADAQGIDQFIQSSAAVTGNIVNGSDSSVNVGTIANATGGIQALADAQGMGVDQGGTGYNASANMTIENSGLVSVAGTADADSDSGAATARVEQGGLNQAVNGYSGNATGTISNLSGGTVTVAGYADADAQSVAVAAASGTGVDQYVNADNAAANGTIDNSGSINVASTASANGEVFANSQAGAQGVNQLVDAENGAASATITNSSNESIEVLADSDAVSASGDAEAVGFAQGAEQAARSDGGSVADATFENSGTLSAGALANAISNDSSASARAVASANGVYQSVDAGSGSASGTITNSSTESIEVAALANASAAGAVNANAGAQGAGQYVTADGNGQAEGTVDNSGSIFIGSVADATSQSESASAMAQSEGINQLVEPADNADGTGRVTNSESIEVTSQANVTAVTGAAGTAGAQGVQQNVRPDTGNATAIMEHTGSVTGNAVTNVLAFSGQAVGNAGAQGLSQNATHASGFADANLTTGANSTIALSAQANVSGSANAFGIALSQGLDQVANANVGAATGSIDAAGDIGVLSNAQVSALGPASANAAAQGINQDLNAFSGSATATLDNSGNVGVEAVSNANSGNFANAIGVVAGVSQEVDGNGASSGSFGNEGNIAVQAQASGSSQGAAAAAVQAFGVDQDVEAVGSNATATANNNGTIAVLGNADATSDGSSATGLASAVGINQRVAATGNGAGTVTGTVRNSSASTIDVAAVATADGSTASMAGALARGSFQTLTYDTTGTAVYENTGTVMVTADATAGSASGTTNAGAEAKGAGILANSLGELTIDVTDNGNVAVAANASGGTTAVADGLQVYAPNLTGSIEHGGNLGVSANAGASGNATANGIHVQTNDFDGSVNNSGNIEVTADGANATANGILIETTAANVTGTGNGNITVVNSGWISAENAINTLNAPTRSDIEQTGGLIQGDILLSQNYADDFTISGGTVEGDTFGSGNDDELDFSVGVDNPMAVYSGNVDGLTSIDVNPGTAYFDGNVTNTGVLNVFDQGRFIVSSEDAPNGPSQINVGEYNQSAGGTLAFEVTPTPNSAGQIQTQGGGDANLAGTVEVVVTPGVYDDTTEYHDVIDAGTNGGDVVGTFDTVQDTALLDLEAVYESDETVDLTLNRTAFDAPQGLTRNQRAVGGGIENAYGGIDPNSDYAEMVTQLFTLDMEEYQQALDDLGNAEHAQGLESLIHSQRMFRRSIFDHLAVRRDGGGDQQAAWLGRFDITSDQLASAGTDESGGPAASAGETQQAAMSRGGRREAGTVSVWARAYGDYGDVDGDQNAQSFDEEQYGFSLGGDVRISEAFAVGLAGGYSESEMDFTDGDSIDYDGYQVGLYGSFEPGAFYLDAMASYAWYDNDSRRDTGLGTAKGDYDSEVFSVQAEAGYGFDLEPATVTPFVGVRYTEAMTDSFEESGAGAANLDVDSGDAESFTTTLGVDLSAEFHASEDVAIIPEIRAGWEHEFEDSRQSIGASFAGAPASSFTVVGSEVADDSAVVGAGLTVDVAQTWQLFVDYDARLNEDVQQHAVSGGVKLSW